MSDQNLVFRTTADSSAALREMQALKRSVDAAGTSWTNWASRGSSAIDTMATGLAKFNLAVGGVQTALMLVSKAWDSALGASRSAAMEKMLPAGALDRVTAAAEGLVTQSDILRLSVRGMTGDFKLTTDQMEVVIKTSLALSQRTGESATVIAERLQDALVKGVQKLDDYGIELEKTGNRANDVASAMEKFKGIVAETNIDPTTRSLQEAQVALKDLAAVLTITIGTAIAELAKLVEWVADHTGLNILDLAAENRRARVEIDQIRSKMDADYNEAIQGQRRIDGKTVLTYLQVNQPELLADIQGALGGAGALFDGAVADAGSLFKKSGKRGGGRRAPSSSSSAPEFAALGASPAAQMAALTELYFDEEFAPTQSDRINADAQASLAKIQGANLGDVSSQLQGLANMLAQKDALIAKNADLAVSEMTLQDAMNNSTAAFHAMFAALAEGANPFSAFIRASANLLKAQAIKDAALALSATAAGLFGINPTGNFAAAAAFAKSAAANTAGAVALGAIAGGGGGSGGARPGSASATGALPGGSITSSGGGSPIIVNVSGVVGPPAEVGRIISNALNEAQRVGRSRATNPERWG